VLLRLVLFFGLALCCIEARSQDLSPDRLGVVYNLDNPASVRVAHYYAQRRGIPVINVIGLRVPDIAVINRMELGRLREQLIAALPSTVQSLLLVWSHPYAVECMSITSAMAAGYRPEFCEPGCGRTAPNPLFDTEGWLPADSAGWLPAMLLPSQDEALARAVIERGVQADGTQPKGSAYLVRTQDSSRNVRAVGYDAAVATLGSRIRIVQLTTPLTAEPNDILAYFTGVVRVTELPALHFRPGAAADHLTSTGGIIDGSEQMSALEWLRQGATASFGSVSEPCNKLEKFPDPAVFLSHYLHGETLLEAYWKSVAMPGQGLFIGEPLARPFASEGAPLPLIQ
jgi:uncharacterized protein (TIGR03790 family)